MLFTIHTVHSTTVDPLYERTDNEKVILISVKVYDDIPRRTYCSAELIKRN